MKQPLDWSRRKFIAGTSAALLLGRNSRTFAADDAIPSAPAAEPVIDIHQHTNYAGRTDERLLAHQRAMGVTTTILLPSGRPVDRPSTHQGNSNGLAAQCGGNETVESLARAHPGEFVFFANEVADLTGAPEEIERYLKLGARGIGEQKFGVACDSDHIHALAGLAGRYRAPILMHFQHEMYNTGIERFHTVLERHPGVNFIGHAQTWWGNIDRRHDQTIMYPTGPVTPGGITDRLLSEYPNMFADLSAGSGLNALLRDEDHTRAFLERHRTKLLYGSDCNDPFGRGPGCQGAQTLAAVRRLAPSKEVERRVLYENARRLFRL